MKIKEYSGLSHLTLTDIQSIVAFLSRITAFKSDITRRVTENYITLCEIALFKCRDTVAFSNQDNVKVTL
jgi:hypothetical protein